jgi:hypothetical protein
LTQELCRTAGLAPPILVEPIAGGRNNRIFRGDLGDGSRVALKCYYHNPKDPRDRLKTEWSFLVYAWEQCVKNVPRPIAASAKHHAALYGFVLGERSRDVSPALVAQAADFVVAINARGTKAQSLAPASEACFSIADHITTIERRVDRLADLDSDVPHVDKARAFVASRLAPSWRKIRAAIERRVADRHTSLKQTIEREILSPSDFGFHNALVDAGGAVTFLDFEYAGRDDPAKLICDFFCQPDVPVPLLLLEPFTRRLTESLQLHPDDLWRSSLLLDAYRVKWVCIMLNDFLVVEASRRAFAQLGDHKERAAHQLSRAEQYLAALKS